MHGLGVGGSWRTKKRESKRLERGEKKEQKTETRVFGHLTGARLGNISLSGKRIFLLLAIISQRKGEKGRKALVGFLYSSQRVWMSHLAATKVILPSMYYFLRLQPIHVYIFSEADRSLCGAKLGIDSYEQRDELDKFSHGSEGVSLKE